MRVTLTFCGLLEAPVEATETAPTYAPAASPAGLTETVTDCGVVPPADAESQLPPELVETLVVKLMAAPLLVVLKLCVGTAAPPVELNVSVAGATDIVGLGGGTAGVNV